MNPIRLPTSQPSSPAIGHMKSDGRLARNFLLGKPGDKLNAILSACGHNLRLILRKMWAKNKPLFIFVLPRRLWDWFCRPGDGRFAFVTRAQQPGGCEF